MENWKDIPGFEGIYQASDLGNIRTCLGKVTHTDRHGVRHWKQREIRQKNIGGGYGVSLWKDGIQYYFLVARLVATTFLDNNINTSLTVNHMDGNRKNNNIENLEWLSLADNIRHGFENGLYPQKAVCLIDNYGNSLHFRSMSEASRFLGRQNQYVSDTIKKCKNVRSVNGEEYHPLLI